MKHKADILNLFFIINPASGTQDKSDLINYINEYYKKKNISPKFYQLNGENDEEFIKEEIKKTGPDAVVAVGGDGTVNLVGHILIETEIPMGIIPMGSANGLAKDLEIPLQLEDALDVIIRMNAKPIDSIQLNEHTVFHLSDLGFNAHIINKFNQGKVRGLIAYAWWMFKEYFTYESAYYEIQTSKRKYKRKAFMVIIANSNKFGSNIVFTPKGRIDDGFFEIVIFKPLPLLGAFKILLLIFNKNIRLYPFRRIIHCKKVTIYNPDRAPFHVDGEPIKSPEMIKAVIQPGKIKIIVP